MAIFDIFFFHTGDETRMGSSTKKKRWPWILAVPVILLVAAMLALKIWFTDDRLKALIVPEIESATHRSVGIGEISFSFFPGIGISAADFTLSNPPGSEFPNPHLLSVKHLFIDVSLLPLLSGRLEVNTLKLEEPVVHLDVTPDGRRNTSAGGGARLAGQAVDPAAGDDGSAPRLGAFLVSNMEITDGRVESYNRKLDSRWIISGLRQTIRLRTDETANTATVEGESDISGFSYGTGSAWYVENLPVSATERLSYDPAGDRLAVSEILLRLKEVPLRATGSVTGLRGETNTVELTLESPELTVEHLLSLLRADPAKGAEVTAAGGASFTMNISGRSNDTLNPGVRGTFVVSNGTARYGSLPGSITGISLDGEFNMPEAGVSEKNAGTLELRTFSATLGTNTLSGRLSMAGFGDPTVKGSLNGRIALGEIRNYYPLEEGTELSGTASCDVSINGRPMVKDGLRASGSVILSGVSYKTAGMTRPLTGLNGVTKFDDQRIIMKDVSMMLGGSDLKLDATLTNYPALMADPGAKDVARPSLGFALKSRTLNTADLTAGEGETAGGTAGSAGSTEAGGGLLLPGIDMVGTVDVETLRTEKFTFTNTKGEIAVHGGVAKLKNMRLEAFGGAVRTSGSLDLRDPAKRPFDLKLDVKDVESNAMLTPFTTFGRYLFGKLTLSTSMKGDLDDTLGISRTTLTGDGTALVADGKVTGLPLLEKLAGFLSAERLKQVDFKSWSQSFSVSDGKLTIKDLKIGGSDAAITVNGVHGLDGSIDYLMNIRLPKDVAEKVVPRGVPPALVEFFRDRDSSMAFDFTVTGQSSSPAVKLDTRAQENLLKKRLGEEAAKKLSDPLKKAAEGLKKLIKP